MELLLAAEAVISETRGPDVGGWAGNCPLP